MKVYNLIHEVILLHWNLETTSSESSSMMVSSNIVTKLVIHCASYRNLLLSKGWCHYTVMQSWGQVRCRTIKSLFFLPCGIVILPRFSEMLNRSSRSSTPALCCAAPAAFFWPASAEQVAPGRERLTRAGNTHQLSRRSSRRFGYSRIGNLADMSKESNICCSWYMEDIFEQDYI